MVFKQILSNSGTPLGSNFWPRKGSGAQTGRKIWNRSVFAIQILRIVGTPFGFDFHSRRLQGPYGRPCVKGNEVSSRSAGLVGKPAFGGEQRERILSKKGGSIEPERCFFWGARKASFRRRARAPGRSKKEGSIEPERCCCWGAGFGAPPKRSSASALVKGNAAGA